ncbi:GTP pyrophosphokinase [Epibacterium sp. Ofav1-8]|uniref:GTP pyrophosphokinase n=1 Tax=Epibacterium sp. Ofav1-8 TaxID=2917735 RepID=UPI001EF53E3B|nr:hypothetical protein [Epibacterium sp. Ofav1-8]MCG7623126.1 hypothetical protein [Epibacterium sp. Ofav1-8]
MSKTENAFFENFGFPRKYKKIHPQLEKLQKNAHSIVEDVLRDEGIPVLQVQSRIKSPESALEKFLQKNYEDPFAQITDFVGLRTIVYLESDVDRAADALRQTFSIDEDNSVDKRFPDAPNVVGYRSLHLICHLGVKRAAHKEYSGICNMPFEVQIRTALTHTWAEIEHKQNYKSSQALPKRLQRKLNLIAATLESVDLQLDSLNKDAKNYRDDLKNEANEEITKDELSDTSLEVVSKKFAERHGIKLSPPDNVDYQNILQDLSEYNIKTVGELRDFLRDFPGEKLKKDQKTDTVSGYLSLAMAANDFDKYLKILQSNKRAVLKRRLPKYMSVTGIEQLEEKLISAGVEIRENQNILRTLLKFKVSDTLLPHFDDDDDDDDDDDENT